MGDLLAIWDRVVTYGLPFFEFLVICFLSWTNVANAKHHRKMEAAHQATIAQLTKSLFDVIAEVGKLFGAARVADNYRGTSPAGSADGRDE